MLVSCETLSDVPSFLTLREFELNCHRNRNVLTSTLGRTHSGPSHARQISCWFTTAAAIIATTVAAFLALIILDLLIRDPASVALERKRVHLILVVMICIYIHLTVPRHRFIHCLSFGIAGWLSAIVLGTRKREEKIHVLDYVYICTPGVIHRLGWGFCLQRVPVRMWRNFAVLHCMETSWHELSTSSYIDTMVSLCYALR